MTSPSPTGFTPEQRRLLAILRERSVRFGRFTLASGRESDFYLDGRQTSLNAEGAWLIGRQVLAALADGVEGVGGLALGADPIGTAAAVASWEAVRAGARPDPVHAFMIRKQAKGHGLMRFVEGRSSLPDGSAVCVVEDTTTTGGSLLTAIERAQSEGLRVVQALTVVDRQEGAVERLAAAGFTLQALFTRADLET